MIETSEQIAPSLTLLFNKSLEEGVFPDEWKLANIVPVYKKDDRQYVENYRPISLLTIISKVLERCVLVRLRDHLLEILDCTQHGFIPGKSCVTQLVEVIDYIGALLDSGKQTDVIYLDMSKAFDKVKHSLILARLRQYNIFYLFIYLLTLCLKLATGNRNSLGQLLRNHYMINISMIL